MKTLDELVVGPIDGDMVHHESRLISAQLSGDVEELAELLSDELLFAGPDGTLAGKTQDIDSYRSGLVRFISHEPSELRICRIASDVNVTYLRTQLSVLVGSDIHKGTFLYTRVWHRELDGFWKVRAGHVSLVKS